MEDLTLSDLLQGEEGGPPPPRVLAPPPQVLAPPHAGNFARSPLQKAVQFASASSTERPMVKVVCVADVVTGVRAAASSARVWANRWAASLPPQPRV